VASFSSPLTYAATILAKQHSTCVLLIAEDAAAAAHHLAAAKFFAPDIKALPLPAWDCAPYDRTSPSPAVVAERLAALTALAGYREGALLIIATANAVVQKVPPPAVFRRHAVLLEKGGSVSLESLRATLSAEGYRASATVREAGEYAVRGSIIDFFPPHRDTPVRLDLFGTTIESIRTFDAATQKSDTFLDRISIPPSREILLTEAAVQRFRQAYRVLAPGRVDADPLFQAVSAGQAYPGMEHWLPLFYETLEPLASFLPENTPVFIAPGAAIHVHERLHLVGEMLAARQAALLPKDPAPYVPVPAENLYVLEEPLAQFTVAALPDTIARPRNFTLEKPAPGQSIYEALAEAWRFEKKAKRKVIIAAATPSSAERFAKHLTALPDTLVMTASSFAEALDQSRSALTIVTAPLTEGLQTNAFTVWVEAEITGERLRQRTATSAAETFLLEANALEIGDFVVHLDHGIGRYEGLEHLTVGHIAHDCVRVVYAGGDKLFVPVENMDVLSRYQAGDTEVVLDRLGAAQWQARKAKAKERIKAIAADLLRVAAERALDTAQVFDINEDYASFCSGFPYLETEDQARAITDTLADLAAGRPMDRLVCGDVGFGKTEVALRAAFVVASGGAQVVVLTPTTLLARQHYANFTRRFANTPLRVAQLSRLVTPKDAKNIREDVAAGKVDIFIATHAALAKSMAFANLGLVVVDEEQHFGVKQKERLKVLAPKAHVLTLSATPIPRTLQLALSGVRSMSLIATPPIDRLAVRTFVAPYDGVMMKEALDRELARGGQVFYVAPRIADLEGLAAGLAKLAPAVRFRVAHGGLSPAALEQVMGDFVDGQFDLLLSTQIIESGIDIPRANTLIIHRAEMFGLGQLYQLRGRVGRGKVRGYAYLTLPGDKTLPKTSLKRLEVMQTLDHLGAGFSLASHDMDMRGSGNLLGDEQSGHIKDVGVALYQQMLEEAIAAAKVDHGKNKDAAITQAFTPVIQLGLPVAIPEVYVPDLSLRLGLYRRAAGLKNEVEVEAFRDELRDRFGVLPIETENLLETVRLKRQALALGISRLDVGGKGVVVVFHQNKVADPDKLLRLINNPVSAARLLPDQRVVFLRALDGSREGVLQAAAGVMSMLV